MNPAWIWLPVLLHVLLCLYLYGMLGVVKARAYKAREVDRKRSAIHADAWPASVIKVNNNIRNQFETPVLFYVLVVAVVIFDGVNAFSVGFAWLFVATRYAHAFIHTSSNYVPIRFRIFAIGLVALVGLLGGAGYSVIQAM